MVISQAKKMKDFKPLFEDLASTMERLVPFLQEIDLLQEGLDPGNGELNFLNKTMLRAEKMVHECSRVRVYSLAKKISYTAEIKRINEDIVKFCQVDLPLIRHRNHLRSQTLKMEESPPRPEETSNICTRALLEEDEQVALAIQESLKEQVKVDEQVAADLQESLNMEKLSLREEELAIQESMFLRQREEQVAKRRARELQKDEQIANGLLYDEKDGISNVSSSSTRADEQQAIWESLKDKGKGKHRP